MPTDHGRDLSTPGQVQVPSIFLCAGECSLLGFESIHCFCAWAIWYLLGCIDMGGEGGLKNQVSCLQPVIFRQMSTLCRPWMRIVVGCCLRFGQPTIRLQALDFFTPAKPVITCLCYHAFLNLTLLAHSLPHPLRRAPFVQEPIQLFERILFPTQSKCVWLQISWYTSLSAELGLWLSAQKKTESFSNRVFTALGAMYQLIDIFPSFMSDGVFASIAN